MCEHCKDLTCCTKNGCNRMPKESVAQLLARAFNPPAELSQTPPAIGRVLSSREVPDYLIKV